MLFHVCQKVNIILPNVENITIKMSLVYFFVMYSYFKFKKSFIIQNDEEVEYTNITVSGYRVFV